MTHKKALVLGANGQDGSYLCESLLGLGWEVVGVGKQAESKWLKPSAMYSYRSLDISDLGSIEALLDILQPDSIFHFAAIHGSAGFQYEAHWKDIYNVNVASVNGALEYFRKNNPQGVLVYASSSKVFFGQSHASVISEESPRNSNCIYTITKNAATDLVKYYRDRYGITASVVWLFNHESVRRTEKYFIPQIVSSLEKSIADNGYKTTIGSLNFYCDWGDAEEYMDIIARASTKNPGVDYIMASGNTWYAEDYVSALFTQFNLDWKDHIVVRSSNKNSIPTKWAANNSKLISINGIRPQRSIIDVSRDILRAKDSVANL